MKNQRTGILFPTKKEEQFYMIHFHTETGSCCFAGWKDKNFKIKKFKKNMQKALDLKIEILEVQEFGTDFKAFKKATENI